jgi:protein translocase SecG subunit
MVLFLTILFAILCVFLVLFILIQQGKGDMGLGGLGGGQMLFGGSGGQDFFQKATWIMGSIFILGALGFSVLKTKETSKSRIEKFATTTKQNSELPENPTESNTK